MPEVAIFKTKLTHVFYRSIHLSWLAKFLIEGAWAFCFSILILLLIAVEREELLFYGEMLKETERTVGVVLIFLSLRAF